MQPADSLVTLAVREAERIYKLGGAVHWIRPNSKAPVKSWNTPERENIETLKRDYKNGYGLGVRTGRVSKIGEGYLANLDVDLKSSEPRHRAEALAEVEKLFPGLLESAPIVATGYGLRLMVLTREPVSSVKLARSSETVKVHMPTSVAGHRQKLDLTGEELAGGYRTRPAWELEFMSEGRQVVLPPSMHPDTQKLYKWLRSFKSAKDIPFVNTNFVGVAGAGKVKRKSLEGFTAVPVDLEARGLPARVAQMIRGECDVPDRSAALFFVAKVMLQSGFSRDEVLSVLTDRGLFLGATGYDHAQTDDRLIAARWVYDFTVAKVEASLSAEADFADEVEVGDFSELTEEAAKAQTAEIAPPEVKDWKTFLTRSDKGKVLDKLNNIVLVLKNAVDPKIFVKDIFAQRLEYGAASPWNNKKKGSAFSEVDLVRICYWLKSKLGIDSNKNTVWDAVLWLSEENGYHPVRDELLALAPWDGTARLDMWLQHHFGARQGSKDYLAQVLRKWLVGSVKRTFEPGAKFDWMPIFEGYQGGGKSSFGRVLFGDRYFSDWIPPLHDKDAALALQGIRCHEFSELDSLRKNEVETTKAFVTRQFDKVRPPYGRTIEEFPRQCIFFGTTNRDEYLMDETGNRRFNPVKVGRLDFDALRRDRDQLWAEALWLYQNDMEESLDLTGDAHTEAIEIRKSKMVSDASTFMLHDMLNTIELEKTKPIGDRFKFEEFQVTELFEGNGPLVNYKKDMRELKLAAKMLREIGAEKFRNERYRYWKLDISKVKSAP